ncbi:MAG: sugar kinase [Roseiflexaceae bacterium]
MPEVMTFGECMAVLYPPDPVQIDDAPLLKWDIGGAEANCAIALARLGISVRWHSRIGNDPFGRKMISILAGEGVDTSAVAIDATKPTGVFFREWLPDGMRRVFYYRAGSAAANMGPEDLKSEHFVGVKAMHMTGITPALSERATATCMRAIELAKAAGCMITFDPNFRPRLWSAEQARVAMIPMAQASDIILMGHEDAAAMFGEGDDEHYLQSAVALGIKTVVLKRAERGALAIHDGERFEATVVKAERVIDPVGAGDGFDAGFIAGRLRGKSMPESLHLGAIVGAGSVAHLGDYAGYPTMEL